MMTHLVISADKIESGYTVIKGGRFYPVKSVLKTTSGISVKYENKMQEFFNKNQMVKVTK